MKHFLHYTRWLFKDFDYWNIVILVSIVSNILSFVFSITGDKSLQQMFTNIGMICLLIYIGIIACILGKMNYKRYRAEQKEMWEKLK
jgi:predicted membrane channel-forming protein YqfA (hemolysin III family)